MAARGATVDGVSFHPGKTLDELDCQKLAGMVSYCSRLVEYSENLKSEFEKLQKTTQKKLARLKKKYEANDVSTKIDGYKTRLESCMMQIAEMEEQMGVLKAKHEELKQRSAAEVGGCSLETEQEDTFLDNTQELVKCRTQWQELCNQRKQIRTNGDNVVKELFESKNPTLQLVGDIAKLYCKMLYAEKADTSVTFCSETAEACVGQSLPTDSLSAVCEQSETSEEGSDVDDLSQAFLE